MCFTRPQALLGGAGRAAATTIASGRKTANDGRKKAAALHGFYIPSLGMYVSRLGTYVSCFEI